MGADETMADAKYLWRKIEGIDKDEINKRDLHQSCRGKFKAIEEMEPALQTLIEMHYIREIETSTGKAGRPSKHIIVNPALKAKRQDGFLPYFEDIEHFERTYQRK